MAVKKATKTQSAVEAIQLQLESLDAIHQTQAKKLLDKQKLERSAFEEQLQKAKDEEEARNAVALIQQHKENALAEIAKAEALALKHGLDFYFGLEYGMGGTFNGEDWSYSGSDSVQPRTGQWRSSSDNC